jgi:hypothetical protein
MPGIADLIAQSKEFGLFDFYLPFIIMFGIMYSLLTKSRIFGETAGTDKSAGLARRVNLIVSLGGALFIMAYVPEAVTLSTFLGNLFGQTFVVLLTIVSFAMILWVIMAIVQPTTKAGEPYKLPVKYFTAIILLFVLLGVAIFFSSGGAAFFPGLTFGQFPTSPLTLISLPNFNISSTDLSILFLVVVTGLIIYFVGVKGDESGGKS